MSSAVPSIERSAAAAFSSAAPRLHQLLVRRRTDSGTGRDGLGQFAERTVVDLVGDRFDPCSTRSR